MKKLFITLVMIIYFFSFKNVFALADVDNITKQVRVGGTLYFNDMPPINNFWTAGLYQVKDIDVRVVFHKWSTSGPNASNNMMGNQYILSFAVCSSDWGIWDKAELFSGDFTFVDRTNMITRNQACKVNGVWGNISSTLIVFSVKNSIYNYDSGFYYAGGEYKFANNYPDRNLFYQVVSFDVIDYDVLLWEQLKSSSDSIDIQNIINNSITSSNQKLDSVISSQNATTGAVNDLKDSLTDSSLPANFGSFNPVGFLPPGPVDSILLLPLNLFNNLTNTLGGVCVPISLTLPFVNSDLSLPCISEFYNSIGITSWVEFIGVIAGAVILFNYFLYLYSWVDNLTHLRDSNPYAVGAEKWKGD